MHRLEHGATLFGQRCSGCHTLAATLFVGPEGGWSPAELAVAGWRTLSLGPRNLRADTAALVGLTLALGSLD